MKVKHAQLFLLMISDSKQADGELLKSKKSISVCSYAKILEWPVADPGGPQGPRGPPSDQIHAWKSTFLVQINAKRSTF